VQGCQMVYFHSDNPDFGILWGALERKALVNFMTIGNILRKFDISYCHWVSLWSVGIFSTRFGLLRQEKSGNPGLVAYLRLRSVTFRPLNEASKLTSFVYI
jgi:hypothetical protein